MNSTDYMVQKIFDCERHCDICIYRHDCRGGVTSGPNGPIYPPCSDKIFDLWADDDLIEEVYNELLEEEMIMIKRVLFKEPATIVFWEDGTKTVVKADGEEFDSEKGLAMAMSQKYFGNKGNYWNEFKKWIKEDDK